MDLPDLNDQLQQLQAMEIDLNLAPNQQEEDQDFDQQEIIFNPVQPGNNFIELNNLVVNMNEEEIQIQQQALPQQPEEVQLMVLADDLH